MTEIFKEIPQIKYEGAESKNPLAFKFYDADRIVFGKKMSEHLPFAMAWWHNLCADGSDMFGRGTADKTFGAKPCTMEHAKAKVDAGFEFMMQVSSLCKSSVSSIFAFTTSILHPKRRI